MSVTVHVKPFRWLPLPLLLLLFAGRAVGQEARTLEQEIMEVDAAFFGALFDRCDVDALAPLVADDFEFVHDKWGLIARSKAEFLTSIRGMCERQRAGTDFKARRVHVAGSGNVYPLKNYGAYQTGSHRFYRVTEGEPDQPTESARFAHVWRQVEGHWQLARVVSYEHVDAPAAGGAAPVPASVSSADAWAAHEAEVVSKCAAASGLKDAKRVGDLIEYDDSVGLTAAMIAGSYPQPHMRNAPGRSLCLFDKRSRTAHAAPADDLK